MARRGCCLVKSYTKSRSLTSFDADTTNLYCRETRSKGGKTIIHEDAFHDANFPHYNSLGSARPKYLAISAGGNDAICIAYIAVTSPDGDVAAWYGDVAENCSVDWYYARTVVGTAGEDPYAPAYVWIDGDHSNGLHYQGLGIHLPNFTGSDARGQQYMNQPELMCRSNARFRAYEAIGANDWIPMFILELPISDTDQDANITPDIWSGHDAWTWPSRTGGVSTGRTFTQSLVCK